MSIDGKSILVTGATGFVGRHLVARLQRDGARVSAIARRADPTLAGIDWRLLPETWAEADIAAALGGGPFDGLIHLAAYGVAPSDRDPAAMFRVNVELTAHLARLAGDAGVKAMVIVGTCAEYDGAAPGGPTPETWPLESAKTYGASKAAGGLWGLAQARAVNLPAAVVRLFHIYGPGERDYRLLPSLALRLARGERVPMSDGAQVRDFVYVHDAVDGLLAVLNGLATRPEQTAWRAVNLATGTGTSVADFARTVCAIAQADPSLLGFGDLPRRPDDIPYLVGDTAAMADIFGWRAATALPEGATAAIADVLGPRR
jgi:nucleoside-diphosphate-sugar epimerase